MIKDGCNEPRRPRRPADPRVQRHRTASVLWDRKAPRPDSLKALEAAKQEFGAAIVAHGAHDTPGSRARLSRAKARRQDALARFLKDIARRRRRPGPPGMEGSAPVVPDRPQGSSGGAAAALDFDETP